MSVRGLRRYEKLLPLERWASEVGCSLSRVFVKEVWVVPIAFMVLEGI